MTKSLRLKAMLIALIVLLSLALIVASYLIARGKNEKHHLRCTYSSCSFRDNYSVRANRSMSL